MRRWRPPDWLTLYPWRRLSAVFRGFLINLCLTPLVAQSGAESGRVTAFSAPLQRKTISLTPHWTRAKTAQDKNIIIKWYQHDFPVFKFSIIGGLYRKFLILPFTRRVTRETTGTGLYWWSVVYFPSLFAFDIIENTYCLPWNICWSHIVCKFCGNLLEVSRGVRGGWCRWGKCLHLRRFIFSRWTSGHDGFG